MFGNTSSLGIGSFLTFLSPWREECEECVYRQIPRVALVHRAAEVDQAEEGAAVGLTKAAVGKGCGARGGVLCSSGSVVSHLRYVLWGML